MLGCPLKKARKEHTCSTFLILELTRIKNKKRDVAEKGLEHIEEIKENLHEF